LRKKKAEVPKVEEKKAEAPKVEAPKTEAPKTVVAPKVEEKKAEVPKVEAPKTEDKKPVTPKTEDNKKEEKKEGVVEEEEEDDEDDIPELEDVTEAGAAGAGAGGVGGEGAGDSVKGKQSRNEKKARKALQKLGLKSVPGIWRVTIKKSKNVPFAISKPDVYKSPVSETYIIFGEAKPEDFQTRAQEKAAQSLGTATGIPGLDKDVSADKAPETTELHTTTTTAPQTTTDDANVDDGGFPKSDIDLVMQQGNVSKAKAVEALKRNSGDIINSIMTLTGITNSS